MGIKRTRNKAITLRLTTDELTKFQNKLKKSGAKNQTDFVMKLLENKPIIVVNELIPFLVELKKQGNNLNQVVRALHEGIVDKDRLEQVLQECHEIYQKLLVLKLGE